MRDLLFIVNEIDFASYADGNTPFVSVDRLEDVLDSQENPSLKHLTGFLIIKWRQILIKISDNPHLLTSALASIVVKIKDNEILNRATIDIKLNFNNHLQKILKKAN